MRRNSLMRIWPNTKIQKEQNKLKKLEKNFHSKISSLEKQIAQFKETLIQIKNSAQTKTDEFHLLYWTLINIRPRKKQKLNNFTLIYETIESLIAVKVVKWTDI